MTNQIANETLEPEDDNSLSSSGLAFRTYSYRENLFAEFDALIREGRRFDGLIVDLLQTGFTVPMETLIKFHAVGKRLLKPQGVILFLKADGAMTLTKDDPGGGLTLNVYDTPFGIFARYPLLADYVCATVSGIDRRRLRGGGNTLANHILYTSTPVLTPRGVQYKTLFEVPPPQNWLLQFIDDYLTAEAIARLMEAGHGIHLEETMRLLQELESQGAIYPIFSRIQFLSNCYHNHKRFRLGRYMVASGIVTPSQLEELLELQQEEGWGRNHRTFLGLLAVRQGYINTRQLDILLHDQFIYGGYHKVSDGDMQSTTEVDKRMTIETMRDSMIGSLGAIDSAGLLQSLRTAKKTGLLTVEHRDKTLIVAFSDGRPTHARLHKLRGYHALVEFLVTWTEGIFVFRDKGISNELDDNCSLSQPLDKLLLDAALLQDQCMQILQELPGEQSAVLERVWNFNEVWSELGQEPLRYFDDTPVPPGEAERLSDMARVIDGLTTLDEIIKACDDTPSYLVLKSIKLLLDNHLLMIQQTSLFRPMTVFQKVVAELQEYLGPADSKALLEASLHYVHGDSSSAHRFHIDSEGRVSVNLSQVKASGIPVSQALLELRRWMEAYLVYVRRQIDPQLVDDLVSRIVHGTT